METRKIHCIINHRKVTVEVDIRESLLETLRNRLHLTGVKKGCAVGECGACTVLIDGMTYDSCIYLAVWADGKEIRTIEGEGADGELTKVQKVFIQEGAIQCGFCTPGVIMSTTALAEQGLELTRADLKRELSGHMCRCTGYQNILKAAEKVFESESQNQTKVSY